MTALGKEDQLFFSLSFLTVKNYIMKEHLSVAYIGLLYYEEALNKGILSRLPREPYCLQACPLLTLSSHHNLRLGLPKACNGMPTF